VRPRRPKSKIGFGIAAVAFLVLAFIAVTLYSTYGTQRTETFTVNHRERTGGDWGKYLVYTDKGVFENTDSVFYLKFDSSDVYGQLAEGGTYECNVYGWRVGVFSWYPNIKDCKTIQVAPGPGCYENPPECEASPNEIPPGLPPKATGGD
jgi:hypothetical protein